MQTTFICTDRGQHPSAVIADFHPAPGGYAPTGRRQPLTGDAPDMARPVTVTGTERADGGTTWRMRCPRCGRDFRVRDDTLTKICDATGRVVDLSLSGM